MRCPETGNPESIDALAGEIETGFDELGKLPSRLERYALAKQRACINLSYIEQKLQQQGAIDSSSPAFLLHLEKVKYRLRHCGSYLVFRNYYTVNRVKLVAASFCMAHLLCPLCAIRRGSKTIEAYLQHYHTIKLEHPKIKMSMVTMTVKNGDDLLERFNHLRLSLQRLFKHARQAKLGKSNTEFSKVLGLFGTYEVTNKGNGWHPHAHMIVLHYDRIDAAKLKAEWLKITGDSKVLRIDPIKSKDPASDFLEVCKYTLKFGDLTPEQNLQAYEVLRGKRLVYSTGLFWGVDVPDNLNDEIPLDWENLPYIEMLYNYVLGSGYNLAKTTHIEHPVASFSSKYAKRIVKLNHLSDSDSDEPLSDHLDSIIESVAKSINFPLE